MPFFFVNAALTTCQLWLPHPFNTVAVVVFLQGTLTQHVEMCEYNSHHVYTALEDHLPSGHLSWIKWRHGEPCACMGFVQPLSVGKGNVTDWVWRHGPSWKEGEWATRVQLMIPEHVACKNKRGLFIQIDEDVMRGCYQTKQWFKLVDRLHLHWL